MIKKIKLVKEVSQKIGNTEGVISVNFVGSFLNKSNFSDIDIVIITKQITKKIINKCHSEIKNIDYKNFGINKKILINDTFGPLKFNTKKNLVFHLMIYSHEDHIRHVINSPLTCYDWERTKATYGLNLKDIYPVKKIFSSDLFSKNRGINIYKKNLLNKTINYKKYIFKKDKVLIKKLNYKILGKDVYEFCYHVITFTIKNYLKYYFQKNNNFTSKQIVTFFKKLYKNKKLKEIIIFYKKLIKFKKTDQIEIDQNEAIDITLNFLQNLETYIRKKEKSCIKLDFIRHFKTKYKKNLFIGQKLDSSILKKNKKNKNYDIAYTSPSLRCLQTSKLYSKKQLISNYLKEINYGKVEGLTYQQLLIQYPYIVKKWKEKKDIKFPSGESTMDVSRRVQKFIKLIKNLEIKKKYLIVTHNVFLRCLIGNYFKIPIFKWHLIKIDYGENFKFKILEKKLFINITRSKFRKIFKKIYENSNNT